MGEICASKWIDIVGNICRPPYQPDGFWCKYDFDINRVYWETVGFDYAYSIRLANLKDICSVLSCLGVSHWIFGKTLLGAVKSGKLLDDHDDDIGVFLEDRAVIYSDAIEKLKALGFTIIRDSEDIISIERDFRYVDICVFRRKGRKKLGYSYKSVDYLFFSSFDSTLIDGVSFPVPNNPSVLIDKLYPSGNLLPHRLSSLGMLTARRSIRRFLGLPRMVRSKHASLVEDLKSPLRRFLGLLAPLSGFSLRTLTVKEFMNLHIEPPGSFNWRWRYQHLSLVTDDCKISRIGQIIQYLTPVDKRAAIDKNVIDTDTSIKFHKSNNLDMRFWWGGNNYFWYCVKYEYRANVVPYALANNYISAGYRPLVYTAEYYKSLPELSDYEISILLNENPIVIEKGSVVSGKHRVFAMIGRLSSGKSYIPVRVIDLG